MICCCACLGRADRNTQFYRADSLNRLAYDLRYKDLDSCFAMARQAYDLADGNTDIMTEALNNLGFHSFMKMDFEQASRLFHKALSVGDNEIDLLISDVGLMKICQRTSMNKEFYDYRNQALRRMRRISEDESLIADPNELKRYHYALSEFYIVSSTYYYYLQQNEESLHAINAITDDMLENDTAQWLYYRYMRGSGGLYEAPTREKVVMGELRQLANCLMLARSGGYKFFEANALQAIAELLNFHKNRILLEENQSNVLRLVNDKNLPIDSLPLYCAQEALKLFKQYDDWYQISGTYRTIATYYNYTGQPEKALPNLEEALSYINMHHAKYYQMKDSTDCLKTFVKNAGEPVELQWIVDNDIKTVPEGILRLREQLSRTYSAMGMKPESDYNRNIYLDLLDFTRQDKALESRYAALASEAKQLNLLLAMVILGLLVLVVLFVLLNRLWRKRNRQYLYILKHVQDLCRKITSAVPVYATENEEVVDAVQQTIKSDFLSIFGAADMKITLNEGNSVGQSTEDADMLQPPVGTSFYTFDLVSPGKSEVIGQLSLALPSPLKKEGISLLRLLLPYLAWTLENGLNLVSLDDEKRRLEKEQYIHEQHVCENKRQNTLKKACLSIVTGILPYIDRVVNEVHKLRSASYVNDEKIKKGKFVYIDELITRINEYNDILALWIKMRQGALSLNIENFELDELFQMIVKGRRAFEMKHQELWVEPTEAVVKADKALTLFMINTLAENARKYTPEGGRIVISAQESESFVEIAVQDDGPGLSADDVQRILGEKVYDSGTIGMSTAGDTEALLKQKGHGFGLMNCKGIIEKYRKTNSVFHVCKFDIESAPGKGSRFIFRLPKGVRKMLSILQVVGFSVLGAGCSSSGTNEGSAKMQSEAGYDSLLVIANDYANKVYDCNVNGQYEDALVYADSVLYYMNVHYMRYSKRKSPLLKLYSENTDAAEQAWLAQNFSTDYYILLDVRNEAAVAGLAVKDFPTYFYNNTAYTVLYKQLSQDHSLGQYCRRMQQSTNNKIVALGLFVLLVVGCLVGYYLLYLRHRLHYRYNMEQVFTINKAIFTSVQPVGQEEVNLEDIITQGPLFNEMNELVPLSNMALGVYDEESHRLKFAFLKEKDDEELKEQMERCFNRRQTVWKEAYAWTCLPLEVEVGGEEHCVGVLAIKITQAYNREEDRLLVELAVRYLAVVLYNRIVRVQRKYNDIELAQDDARRALFEENMLHVQNMVLDNCLSTIKHETIYYPNRIKQIIDKLNAGDGVSEEEEKYQLQTIDELVNYYKDIFTLLSSCAARQLDEITFRRTDVDVAALAGHITKYLKKCTKKLGYTLDLQLDVEAGLIGAGDKVLMAYLLENLVDEAVRYRQSGTLSLKVKREGDFVRFDFTDFRRMFTQEELNSFFYPSLGLMHQNENGEFVGTEYLVCKQIIRDHDGFAGRRGCRINAEPVDGGFTVWFTIPFKSKK